MLEVTEQRPMNNEHANASISRLSAVTLNATNVFLSIDLKLHRFDQIAGRRRF